MSGGHHHRNRRKKFRRVPKLKRDRPVLPRNREAQAMVAAGGLCEARVDGVCDVRGVHARRHGDEMLWVCRPCDVYLDANPLVVRIVLDLRERA